MLSGMVTFFITDFRFTEPCPLTLYTEALQCCIFMLYIVCHADLQHRLCHQLVTMSGSNVSNLVASALMVTAWMLWCAIVLFWQKDVSEWHFLYVRFFFFFALMPCESCLIDTSQVLLMSHNCWNCHYHIAFSYCLLCFRWFVIGQIFHIYQIYYLKKYSTCDITDLLLETFHM